MTGAVRKLYNHAVIGKGMGALKAIQDPEVNLSIATDVVSAGTHDYVNGIDWHGHFKSDWDTTPTPMGRENICRRNCSACTLFEAAEDRVQITPAVFGPFNPRTDALDGVVRAGLHKFPQGAGFDIFCGDVAGALRGFAEATGAQNISANLVAKYPTGHSTWHRDTYVNIRGLLTFKGPGTFWRPNDDVALTDWEKDERDSEGRRINSFGQFGKTFMERARQIETGHMSLFKGGLATRRPLIHAEPTYQVTDTRRDMRLLLMMDMA